MYSVRGEKKGGVDYNVLSTSIGWIMQTRFTIIDQNAVKWSCQKTNKQLAGDMTALI